jgi:hypothetical protein
MSMFGKDGNPVYSTSEIAGEFHAADKIMIADNSGFCIRFTVPRIRLGDYCFINAAVTFPKEMTVAGKTESSIESDYKYDSKASGKTEYIWFLFDASAPAMKIPGVWKLKLSSGGKTLVERAFTVTAGN